MGNDKQVKRLLERDPDYFRKLGRKGGLAKHKRHTFDDKEIARRAAVTSHKKLDNAVAEE